MATKPHVLVFGANGQVGTELRTALEPIARLTTLGRGDADFSAPESLRPIVRSQRPEIIVNAAAYTAVDRAESEPDLAHTVNAIAPSVLAQEAEALGAAMVHYSTDYVFDGRKDGPYRESDAPNPLSVYGRTKLAGELGVSRECQRHLILRTSWVYAAHGTNFLRTILRLAAERDTLRIVADQFGAPTSAARIAATTATIMSRIQTGRATEWGTYHVAAAGETTWHEYARFAVAEATRLGASLRTPLECIFPITTAEYRTAAERPVNSRLDTSKVRQEFEVELPYWRADVLAVLRGLVTNHTQ